MTKMVFLDTVGFIALGNKDDFLHQHAISLNQKLLLSNTTLITTDAIFIEVANTFSKENFRSIAINLIDNFRNSIPSGLTKEIHINHDLLNRGWEVYKKHIDKNWSLTDCISFTVMKDLNIKEAFTSDKHYEQAGFIKLLFHPLTKF